MFPVHSVLMTKGTKFAPFQPVRVFFLILASGIVPALALGAIKGNNFLHWEDATLIK